MRLIRDKESGELQCVEGLDGYDMELFDDLGEVPDDVDPMLAAIDPEGAIVEDLAACRARQWAIVKAARDAAMTGGCDTPAGRVDTDEASQLKINGAVSMAMLLGESFAVDWTMADNNVVSLDAAAMKAMGIAVGTFIAECHAAGQALRAAIEAATDRAGIEAVTWGGL